jgi:hypothetical protein
VCFLGNEGNFLQASRSDGPSFVFVMSWRCNNSQKTGLMFVGVRILSGYQIPIWYYLLKCIGCDRDIVNENQIRYLPVRR